ncbi:MAG: hypothetical protein JNG84_10125, partial [Archangium sp.]|nr:hypothetical protein [Archangium sp.]
MSEARVDKRWKEKDLDGYSIEAILGTLKHYGVALTEDEFRTLAATSYPLSISWRWAEAWKGTGQFSDFHAAAAQELWHRVRPGAFAPSDLAVPLINLLHAMHDVIDGKKDDGTRETRFSIVEAYLAKLPTEPEARAEFEHEAYALLGDDWREVFDAMAEALAEEKH